MKPDSVVPVDRVKILGVQVACLNTTMLLDRVDAWARQATPRTILYVNAHCLNTAYKNAEYRSILNAADLVYSDGISVVWSSRLLGGCNMQKITGADWIEDFCRRAQDGGLRIYILAGKPGIAEQAARRMVARYPGLQITGTCDGYLAGRSDGEILEEINRQAADIVFVGMGVPLQETWLAEHRRHIAAPVCWSVGALFDFVSGNEPRVPAWMNRLALEWLWRLMIDPAGKWRRYVLGNPVYIYRILRQRLTGNSP